MNNKQSFEKFVKVQKSGKTNMYDLKMVQILSGLARPQIIDIMKNYEKYEKEFTS